MPPTRADARVSRRIPVVALLLALLSLQACVGPVLVDEHYRGKAIESLETMRSVVDAVALTVGNTAEGRVFAGYASVLVRQKEEEAASIHSAFATRQPPAGYDDLRAEVEPLLAEAVAELAQVRIAAFRAELDASLRAPLEELAARLDRMRREVAP